MTPVVETVVVGRWSVNCHIIHDGRSAIIIDPGDDAPSITERISGIGARPLAIVNTHGHFDHVGAVSAIKRHFGIPFLIHEADRRLVTHANLYRRLAGEMSVIETPRVDAPLPDAGRLDIGSWRVEVIPTPGHTPGSVCLRVDDILFSGDTLLADGVGRTDLPGGGANALMESLELLRTLPGDLRLFPGHGPSATLAESLAASAVTASR